MTERPFEDRSDVVKELYSELNVIKPISGQIKFLFPCITGTHQLRLFDIIFYITFIDINIFIVLRL